MENSRRQGKNLARSTGISQLADRENAKGASWEAPLDAETQNRTVDTAIFSRVLYQLSYLGLRTIFYMDMAKVSSKMSELAVMSIKSS